MPTAPRPDAVATAAMGSSNWASMRRFFQQKGEGPRSGGPFRRVVGRRGYLVFFVPSTPRRLLITHCWAIDSTLLVIQYSTRPAGKKKNITLNTSGMIHISRACIGSGGVGLSQVCSSVVAVITRGRMNHGSGAERSLIHRIQGAW